MVQMLAFIEVLVAFDRSCSRCLTFFMIDAHYTTIHGNSFFSSMNLSYPWSEGTHEKLQK